MALTAARRRESILVLRALGLGDLLTAFPALRALRARFPRHRITLAAPETYAEVARMSGAVDGLVPTSGPTVPPWNGPAPWLAVNLHGSGPQSVAALRRLEPTLLWTHAHPDFPDLDGPAWNPNVHEVRRWCRLLHHYGVAADPDDLRLRHPPATGPRPGAVVVHPGAAFPARRWPQSRFAWVARRLAEMGYDVVITGTMAERLLASRVARLAGLDQCSVLAGETSPAELTALVAGASLVVCGDTGVAHVATACATPSVVLFGPVAPAVWGPPAEPPIHVGLWSGHTGDPFASEPNAGLLEISAARVVAAAVELLRSPRRLPPDQEGARA